VDVRVFDTGIGISQDFLAYVFEPFRQADGSSGRKSGGLGLGLAIVRHVAELHGGRVEARSAGEDQGSTFVLTLPVATGREAIEDFPEWNPAHKTLLAAGIPTIENVGADLDEVSGKRCTFQGFPWKWHEGDACVIRLVAIFDPSGNYRIESGRGAER